MKIVLDVLQGLGVSAAAGLRPFLPALVVGGLAAADAGVDFDGTDFAFLEDPGFLAAMAAGLVLSILGRRYVEGGPGEAALAGLGIGLGARCCSPGPSTTATTRGGRGWRPASSARRSPGRSRAGSSPGCASASSARRTRPRPPR
jgi:hypothetical protein